VGMLFFFVRLADSENKSLSQAVTEEGNRALLAASFMPVSCSAYSSTLKMEVTYCSKILVDFQQTTWHCILEDRTLHNHLKSYILWHVDLLLGGDREIGSCKVADAS
jgi:hypothetical protein